MPGVEEESADGVAEVDEELGCRDGCTVPDWCAVFDAGLRKMR